MTEFVNYPLTASDDDEFFDAPEGSKLLNPAGAVAFVKLAGDFDWEMNLGGVKLPFSSGEVWASFFADGNPFGEHDIAQGWVLQVSPEWAAANDMCEGGWQAAEARAEARVAAWMKAGTA